MKHTTKTLLFKSLSLLPNKLGYAAYHTIQQLFDSSDIQSKIKKSENTTDVLLSISNSLNIDLQGKTILEIGSGWLPIMPYFFISRCHVKKVFTYDINEHYRKKAISHFNAVFSEMFDYPIVVSNKNKFNLPEEVTYFPLQNVVKIPLPKADIIFSRYVLSHVSPEDIIAMHKKFRNEFEKGTYIIHFISPSDLRQHGDKSISMQDFLKYSQKEWDAIMTKFDYHNRWRLPHYIETFRALGFEILFNSYESVEEGSSNQKLFRELQIHDDFKKYTEEELTAGNIVFVLRI